MKSKNTKVIYVNFFLSKGKLSDHVEEKNVFTTPTCEVQCEIAIWNIVFNFYSLWGNKL